MSTLVKGDSMRKNRLILAVMAAALLTGLVAAPATVAGAAGAPNKVWVNGTNALVAGGGSSCTKPGYRTIQTGISAVATGGTVEICAGTYTEQLTLTKSASLVGTGGTVTIKLPASPANATSSCAAASNTAEADHLQDEIDICGAVSVSITGVTVVPKWAGGTCNDDLYGILVAGGASLTADDVIVNGGGAFPINGCQGGIGIEVGMAWTSPVSKGTASLKNVTVNSYQKGGIVTDGAGSNATISKSTVTGAGATTQTAQNGIQISNGAKATVSGSTISNNECDYPSVCGSTGTQAAGILLYGSAPGSSVTGSTISNNDFGLYYISVEPTEAASGPTTISKDHFTNNRDEGILLDQGKATLSHDDISASLSGDPGDIGILVYQYVGQTYASAATATKCQISGQSVAVEVSTDGGPPGNTPGTDDLPGTFNISHSGFLTGNTSATSDTSTNYTITGTGNH